MFLEHESKQFRTELKQVVFVIIDLLELLVDELVDALVLDVLEPQHPGQVEQIEKSVLIEVDVHIGSQLVVELFHPEQRKDVQQLGNYVVALERGLDTIETSQNLFQAFGLTMTRKYVQVAVDGDRFAVLGDEAPEVLAGGK